MLRLRSLSGWFGRTRGLRRLSIFTDVRFQDLAIDPRLLRGLEVALGPGARLTSVQQQAILRQLEDPCQKRPDLLLQAHTGTGKTIAFLLPVLQRLLALEADGQVQAAKGVFALVLAPTRELVLQLAKVASGLLLYSGGQVRSSFVAGGFSMQEDIERLKADAPHILFATPWRLVHHLQSTPHFVRALGSIEVFLLDEADRLLDPVFIHKVDYIFRCLSSRPQMVLCSATFSEHIRKFAMRSLRANLEVISTVEADAAKAHLEVAQPVDQVLVRYEPQKFLPVLHALLVKEMLVNKGEPKRVLVIFPTVRWLQFFYVLLKHRANMPGLLALHRSLADDRRRSRAFRFSRGAPATMGALFATDVAARGMDFDVHTVIQVGPPEDREQYVHRAGRTGRLESSGRSILLLNPLEERILQELNGLQLHREEAVEEDESFSSVENNIHGWWEDAGLSASGHLFFASAIAYYLNELGRLRVKAGEVVQTVSGLLQSTGLPKEFGLPAIPRGLADRLRQKDELVAVRTETDLLVRSCCVRERWDVLSALTPHPSARGSPVPRCEAECQSADLDKGVDAGSFGKI
ncbi:unnamed protein product [Durusdinium trenchii]|uniref:ATP-dependent RNA helicase n=1 Tax=Durusdinium trenchii TaxID=1381693 RepID=A0ABP0NN22_9DINO